jgi:hypothetical protein
MLDPTLQLQLRERIRSVVVADRDELAKLRDEVRTLRPLVRAIQPRSATAISLVGTDGGNNRVEFDPFLVHLVRVVDSSAQELMIEAVTPRTSLEELNRRQFDSAGRPATPIGEMLSAMGMRGLNELHQIFRKSDEERAPGWIQEYRNIAEWAVLLQMVRRRDYGSDTLIVRDGPLREKMFVDGAFGKYVDLMNEAIGYHRKRRCKVYIVGVIKHSKVLQRYRLAMALEGILRSHFPAYAPITTELLKGSYRWKEWFEIPNATEFMVAGQMFLVKFGPAPQDSIWVVDIWKDQVEDAPRLLGYLQRDAHHGFPIPYYPMCLQRAHDAAALVDFDQDILEWEIRKAMDEMLGPQRKVLHELALQETDVSSHRY